MAKEYLPKVIIAMLALSIALILISAQPTQVAALSNPQNSANAHPPIWKGGHSNWHWTYYRGYPYYSYYYSFYVPYYYPYPYYYSSYCPSNPNYYAYPYYYSGYYYSGYNYNCSPSSYTVSVNTDPSNLGTVNGGGSFTPGSSASFSVTQSTIQVSPSTRYVFDHWSGDYSGAGTSGTVTVNNAMAVTANYQLQYYLSVSAQPQNAPSSQGAGW